MRTKPDSDEPTSTPRSRRSTGWYRSRAATSASVRRLDCSMSARCRTLTNGPSRNRCVTIFWQTMTRPRCTVRIATARSKRSSRLDVGWYRRTWQGNRRGWSTRMSRIMCCERATSTFCRRSTETILMRRERISSGSVQPHLQARHRPKALAQATGPRHWPKALANVRHFDDGSWLPQPFKQTCDLSGIQRRRLLTERAARIAARLWSTGCSARAVWRGACWRPDASRSFRRSSRRS